MQPGFPTGRSGLAGLIESLLGSVAGMCMQKGDRKRVADLLSGPTREPMASLPIDTKVLHHSSGVNSATLAVQGIGLILWQVAEEDACTDHTRTIVLYSQNERKKYIVRAKASNKKPALSTTAEAVWLAAGSNQSWLISLLSSNRKCRTFGRLDSIETKL